MTIKTIIGEESGLPLTAILAQVEFIKSDVENVVIAAVSEPQQRAAVLRLIGDLFSRKRDWIQDLATGESGVSSCVSEGQTSRESTARVMPQ